MKVTLCDLCGKPIGRHHYRIRSVRHWWSTWLSTDDFSYRLDVCQDCWGHLTELVRQRRRLKEATG